MSYLDQIHGEATASVAHHQADRRPLRSRERWARFLAVLFGNTHYGMY